MKNTIYFLFIALLVTTFIQVNTASAADTSPQLLLNHNAHLALDMGDSIKVEIAVNDETCLDAGDGVIFISSITGGTPPYSYTLNGVTGTPPFYGLFAGSYDLIISDSLDCTTQIDVFVGYAPAPPTPSIFPGSGTYCVGDTMTLTCEAPPGYITYWYIDGVSGPEFIESGDFFSLTSEYANQSLYTQFSGCEPSGFSNAAWFGFESTPSVSVQLNENELTASTTEYDYSFTWYFNGEILSNPSSCGTGCIIAQEEGEYYACDSNQCGTGCSQPIYYEVVDMELPKEIDSVHIFPNPVTDILNLHLSLHKTTDAMLQIHNTQGQVVMQENYFSEKYINASINISDLASGIYYANIQTASGVWTRKVVK